jgi:plastocyanin
MKTWTVAVAIALTAMTASCGGDEPEPAASAPAADREASAPSGDAQVLTGTVGTQDDPDAFEITLTDSTGEEVTELPAGAYSIVVDDLSEIHNFHLEGGDVDEATIVPETGETTWDVELTAGDYTAICDPHPGMRLDFTVT